MSPAARAARAPGTESSTAMARAGTTRSRRSRSAANAKQALEIVDMLVRSGSVDVVVTEGFSGNIALKTAEGTAKQIAAYPWFAHKKEWQKEIHKMIENGFKLEVESLISKDISYVTEQYTPARLKAKDWLD